MVKEHRELIFSNNDLLESIMIFPNKASLQMPEGKITGISIIDDAYVFAIVQILKEPNSELAEVALDSSILAAIMLFYCRANKIPVPKNAEKKITKVEAGLSLNITIF